VWLCEALKWAVLFLTSEAKFDDSQATLPTREIYYEFTSRYTKPSAKRENVTSPGQFLPSSHTAYINYLGAGAKAFQHHKTLHDTRVRLRERGDI
jgi:hypothetical protein